jgi:hypothetical protein
VGLGDDLDPGAIAVQPQSNVFALFLVRFAAMPAVVA